MSDRSDEVTTDARSTEELLEETERLLSEDGTSEREESAVRDTSLGGEPTVDDPSTRSPTDDGSASTGRTSRLGSLGSRLSLSRYFSPKAFLALVLAIGAGLLVGGFTVPIGGRIVGMAAVAFLVGLVGSTRRYLEVGLAGVTVGGVSALLNHAVLAVAGSFGAVTAVGVGVGFVGCLFAYYFGRDLRNGLTSDIE